MSLVVDTREPQEIAILLSSRSVPFTERALSSGDYAIQDIDGCTLGIERKTARDLVHTFGSVRASDGVNRLYSQMQRMQSDYTSSILLIEEPLFFDPGSGCIVIPRSGKNNGGGRLLGWNHGAIVAALLAVQFRYDVRLIPVSSMEATVDVLRMLSERASGGCVLKSQRENREDKREAATVPQDAG